MELRWFKYSVQSGGVTTEIGTKLQYRDLTPTKISKTVNYEWQDVQMVEDKPKEKTLEEKFLETSLFCGDSYSKVMTDLDKCKVLAEIARAHFESSKP